MSPEDISKLKSLVKTHTWEQIAKEFNRHPDAIRREAKRLGVRKYILNKAEAAKDMSIMSYSEAHGCKAAAKYYNTTQDAIKSARRRIRKRRAKIANAMNGARYERFRLACYKMAHKHNQPYMKEDFASWAVVKTLEGRNSSIDNLWRDFRSLVSNYEHDSIDNHHIASEPPEESRDLFELADRLKLDMTRRIIFLLRYKEDLDMKEIGNYFKVSESRISQMLSGIKDRLIKEKMEQEK